MSPPPNLPLLTHDLSDGHRLSQRGRSAGAGRVVGSDAELQFVPGGQVFDDQGRPLGQTLHGWYPFIS